MTLRGECVFAISRFVQGSVAGVGAALSGLGLFVFLGPAIILDSREIAGMLAFVATSSFGLVCIRASAHRFVN